MLVQPKYCTALPMSGFWVKTWPLTFFISCPGGVCILGPGFLCQKMSFSCLWGWYEHMGFGLNSRLGAVDVGGGGGVCMDIYVYTHGVNVEYTVQTRYIFSSL